jgi:hypothetical protein
MVLLTIAKETQPLIIVDTLRCAWMRRDSSTEMTA